MKRKYYRATFRTDNGASVQRITQAMNSGIRATEDMAREYARSAGLYLYGDVPERVENVYTRRWSGGGVVGTATVREVETSA